MLKDSLETPQLTVNNLVNVKNKLLREVLKNASLIQVPTLILQEEAGTVVSVTGAKQLYSKLNAKDKKLELFTDAGHWFYDALCPVSPRAEHGPEKRGQFIVIIKDWLTQRG